MASARDSATNSQYSSFDDSQGSQHHPFSTGSFSSSQPHHPRDTTPTTSLSNPSSQEYMAEKPEQRTNHPAPRSSRGPAMLDTRFIQAPLANMGGPHQDYTSAPKRSADGEIKQANRISPTSPGQTTRYEHSRTSSTTSRGSQISELSSKLKTHLAYAAVKVQNGWETQNINDLENHIKSTQASPVSTASTLRRPYDSSRPGSSSTHPGGFMQSSERSTATATPDHAPHQHAGTAGLDYAYPRPTSATQSPPSAHTYEAFWREHSHANSSRVLPPSSFSPSSATAKPTAGPSLAPAVDITPRSARRTNAPSSHLYPPHLQTATTANTNNAAIALANMPATPPPQPPKTAMETDAIETLMCMSSPKNLGYHLPSSQPQNSMPMPRTPLRQHIDGTLLGVGSRGGFPVAVDEDAGRIRSDADVERLLDETGDGSSESSDEEGVDALRGRQATLRA